MHISVGLLQFGYGFKRPLENYIDGNFRFDSKESFPLDGPFRTLSLVELWCSKVSPKSSSRPPLCAPMRKRLTTTRRLPAVTWRSDMGSTHSLAVVGSSPTGEVAGSAARYLSCSKAACAQRSSPNKRWPSSTVELGTQAARQVEAEGSLAGVGWKPPGSFAYACYCD